MTLTADALRARVEEQARAAGGIVGVSATHLPSGRHVGYHEDDLFPTASVFKVPVLVAFFDAVRRGELDPRERAALREEDRVAGSGVLQDLDAGLTPTWRDLAVLMITVSDNLATDLVVARLGRERVEALMAELGLDSIKIPYDCRALLYEMVGMDPSEPGGYEENRRRLRLALGEGGRAVDPEVTTRATPRDVCRLFELIEARAILDRESCDAILDICQRQKFGELIPARLPLGTITARKTGSLRGVRNDAGIVYGPRGPYAIGVFSRQLPDVALGTRALADLSLLMYEHFNPA